MGIIEIFFYLKTGASKVGYIFPMVIISAEFGPAEFGPAEFGPAEFGPAEFGSNGHLEDASHFTISNIEF